MFLSPLLSTLMSFLLLHEVPGMGTFVGGADYHLWSAAF